jgi:hypothetical protein
MKKTCLNLYCVLLYCVWRKMFFIIKCSSRKSIFWVSPGALGGTGELREFYWYSKESEFSNNKENEMREIERLIFLVLSDSDNYKFKECHVRHKYIIFWHGSNVHNFIVLYASFVSDRSHRIGQI